MKKVAWVDKDYKQLEMQNINDKYLVNILGFICKGGGYDEFVTAEKITDLFKEAEIRGLTHPYKLKDAFKSWKLGKVKRVHVRKADKKENSILENVLGLWHRTR